MYSISQATKETLALKPYILELLELDIVNITELARVLRPEIESKCMKPVSVEALAMALRRLPKVSAGQDLQNIFTKPPEIIVRLKLSEITVRKRNSMQKVLKLIADVAQSDRHFFTLTQGIFEDTIVVSSDYVQRALSLFDASDVVVHIEGIAAVTIRLDPSNVQTPGVYYHILRSVFLEHINVIEVVSTYMECTLLVAEKDVERTFATVKRLFKSPSHPQ